MNSEPEEGRRRARAIELDCIQGELSAIDGVTDVDELHVSSIGSGERSLVAHLLITERLAIGMLSAKAREIAANHGIRHTDFTFDIEHIGGPRNGH